LAVVQLRRGRLPAENALKLITLKRLPLEQCVRQAVEDRSVVDDYATSVLVCFVKQTADLLVNGLSGLL
jgi:hypothetical protein